MGLTDRRPHDTVRPPSGQHSAGGPCARLRDIDMALKINVTWPENLGQICIQMDCGNMEPISSKATTDGAHITVDGAFGPGNRVCDEDRYRIGRESEDPLECCESDAHFDQTLVLLLESPHEKEYANGCIDRPLVPALGKTGRNIRDHLMHVIRECNHLYSCFEQDVNVRVMIANPIQFQCSLVSVIKHERGRWGKTRDLVWKTLWSQQSIRDDFRNRLERYHPDFIINACTHDAGCKPRCPGGDPECRKQKIHDFLAERFAHIYESPHPSGWWSRGNRRLTHICTS